MKFEGPIEPNYRVMKLEISSMGLLLIIVLCFEKNERNLLRIGYIKSIFM